MQKSVCNISNCSSHVDEHMCESWHAPAFLSKSPHYRIQHLLLVTFFLLVKNAAETNHYYYQEHQRDVDLMTSLLFRLVGQEGKTLLLYLACG